MSRRTLNLLCLFSLAAFTSLRADTLFSPGSITIGTNQAILITTIGDNAAENISLDGQVLSFATTPSSSAPFAISGNHILKLDGDEESTGFITYQLLNGSSIKTIYLNTSLTTDIYGDPLFSGTNSIYIPAGKTAQFFSPIVKTGSSFGVISPQGSNSVYNLFALGDGNFSGVPVSITGPVTITFSISNNVYPAVVSYYLTDEILQLPPEGFLNVPAPALEVDVQKSYDLTTWTNVGAFNTSAEAGAFYRLKILQ